MIIGVPDRRKVSQCVIRGLGLRSDTKMPRLDMLRLQEGAEIVTVTKVHPAQTLAFL